MAESCQGRRSSSRRTSVLAVLLLALALLARPWLSQVALILGGVQLALSVFSRGDYLFTHVARTGNGDFPSDVANMASALWLPYWFWGAVCGAFSVAMLALGVWLFLRSLRSKQTRVGGLTPSV